MEKGESGSWRRESEKREDIIKSDRLRNKAR